MIRSVFIFVVVLILSACSSAPKETGAGGISQDQANDLDMALKDLESENYTSAATALEALAKKDPASELDLVILYNLGVAREGLKQCNEAAEKYRSVARIANKKFERVEALALYRLGFVYECMGQPQKSIVAFLDARKRRAYLPTEVAEAELPARLAAGYSSLGRRKEALRFFNEASNGLKRLLARSNKRSQNHEFVAKTLLSMGKIARTSEPFVFLRMMSMQQPFLLQAVELGTLNESPKAARELIAAYVKISDLTADVPTQELRSYLIEGLKVSRELKRMRLPDSAMRTQAVFVRVEQVERDFESRLAQMPGGVPRTEETQRREGLKREGRVQGTPVFENEKAKSP